MERRKEHPDFGGQFRDTLVAAIIVVTLTSSMQAENGKSRTTPEETYGPTITENGKRVQDAENYLESDKTTKAVNPEREVVEFPVNQVQWGPGWQPIDEHSRETGELQIWDVTRSPYRKIVKLKVGRYYDQGGNDFSSPVLTLYIEAGTRGIIRVPPGEYEILGMSGGSWNGRDFGEGTTAVTFGRFKIGHDRRTILAMGATDQEIIPISKERFGI